MNTHYFLYDNSRFESFKSSGYLRLIENDSLSLAITNLYTLLLPWQVNADKLIYKDRRRDFITYIGSKTRINSSDYLYYTSDIVTTPEVQFQIKWQRVSLKERSQQMQFLKVAIDTVMTQIDQELKTRFNYKGK